MPSKAYTVMPNKAYTVMPSKAYTVMPSKAYRPTVFQPDAPPHRLDPSHHPALPQVVGG
jgi:hypothetical protein